MNFQMYKTRNWDRKHQNVKNQNPYLGFKIRISILKTEFIFYRVIDILIIYRQSQHQNQNPYLVF